MPAHVFRARAFLDEFYPSNDDVASQLHTHGYKPLCVCTREAVRKWRERDSIPGGELAALIWCLTIENLGTPPDLSRFLVKG